MGSSEENRSGESKTKRLSESASAREDHWRGTPNAEVTIVAYSDFAGEASASANMLWRQIEQISKKSMCYVFRHFPFEMPESQSFKASEVAEAAALQGKFWEMHDSLFVHQENLSDADLVKRAVRIELNVERFLRDIADGVCVNKIRRDLMSGAASGVGSAPTFFINDVIYEGLLDSSALIAAINAA